MMRTSVLIIGSGVAALQLAKSLRCDMNVIILTKSDVKNGNSYMAQGGVAAALAATDEPYKHFMDTMEAGRYHNDAEVVAMMTWEAPTLIKMLKAEGCPFDTDENGNLVLGMEGAHSEKRIVHGGGDATGKIIMDFLVEDTHENVQIIENMTAYELITENRRCIGVKAKGINNKTEVFFADHIVLATGGLGQIYSFTSNADSVSGDGIAMAYMAGAEVTDMEFIQFHPTLLYVDGKGKGLVSEAVRGEGALLVTSKGQRIMKNVHPLEDLAPRHVVSQTIYDFLKRGESVYLDISTISNFEQRFPTITALCNKHHIDLSVGKIPVVPGCHFLMGGIKTDLYGRTNIDRLYAIGETACTGIHGANRLASNSLLEGLFFGKRLAQHLIEYPFERTSSFSSTNKDDETSSTITSLRLPDSHSIQSRMMDFAGIVRTKKGLMEQYEWLESFEVEKWVSTGLGSLSLEDINTAFMLINAWLVTKSALERTESRGGHFREDFPVEDDKQWLKHQIIHRRKEEEGEQNEQVKAAIAT